MIEFKHKHVMNIIINHVWFHHTIKIIITVAWVKEKKTIIKIEFPQFCPAREEQIKTCKMLIILRTYKFRIAA